MKLLILTQYFPPEVGAPQNRLYELAVRLQQKGMDITILTAMPNYPQMEVHTAYKGKYYYNEEMSEMKVHRAWIYVSKSKSILFRLMNYFSFVFSSLIIGLYKIEKQDVVLVESPPLFLGITAYLLSRAKRAKMVFNVSDLWPESAEKLGLISNKTLLKLSTYLEEFCYKQSALITGQTQGICANISSRFPEKKVYWLKNGVDINFYNSEKILETNWRFENGFKIDDFLLIYAGIIGYAQGLEIIIEAAKTFHDQNAVKFILLGSGPEKEKLQKLCKEYNLTNVYFFDVVTKHQMQNILISTDVSIIPLRKLDLFKGAIPSKIFESLALKRPILLGVDGEAKELFIEKGQCGLFFEPENVASLVEGIDSLIQHPELRTQYGKNAYEYVASNFNRDIIANEFWEKLKLLN
ncbi:MAG: glycosyltransferase family 4 protein [Bacteroidales bacterium]